MDSPASPPPRRTELTALLIFAAAFPWVILGLLYLRMHVGARAEEDAAMLPTSSLNMAITLAVLLNALMILIGTAALLWRFYRQRKCAGLMLGICANLVTLAAGLYLLMRR